MSGERALRIGHLVANHLEITENWIHRQMVAAPAVLPLVLNRGARRNDDLYPAPDACHLEQLSAEECRSEADSWEAEGFSQAFYRACRAFGCDVLHAHFGTEGAMGAALADALGVPLVTSFYGYDVGVLPADPLWRGALGRLFSRGSLFLAEGPALARTLVRLGCPRERVRVLPLPAGAPVASPHRAADPPLILICGRLVEKKGVDDSLRALAALRRIRSAPRFRAAIVGDGPERVRLVELQRSLGLEDCVTFTGTLSPAALRKTLARATVVLQMSRESADGDCEGGAPVILSEALAAAVPAVATRHCDIPFIVEDGETGFIVESGDHRVAADRIARLLTDGRLRAAMARRGRRKAAQELSLAACGARLRRCYEEALARPNITRRGTRVPSLSPGVPPIVPALVLELRRRAGDLDGLARMLSRMRRSDPLRGAVLRAMGEANHARKDFPRAARCFRKWSVLAGEAYGFLEEARAWLDAGEPRAIRRALARFVDAHEHRGYAITIVEEWLASRLAPNAQRSVVRALARTPAERLRSEARWLAHDVARADPACDRRPLQRRLVLLTRRLEEIVATAFAATEAAEEAMVELLTVANRLSIRPAAARICASGAPLRFTHAVPRYRLASLLETGSTHERDWARRTFERLAETATAGNDVRAGAFFHLARLHLAEGQRAEGLQCARRCLVFSPGHGAAAGLLEMCLEGRRRAS